MAIITLTEVKNLLQISDSSKDSLISALIPIVQSYVTSYCNNYFEVVTGPNYDILRKTNMAQKYYVESYNISFTATSRKVNTTENDFVTSGFIAGAHLRVSGSLVNDGIFKISSVGENEIILDPAESLTDEPAGNVLVRLSLVSFPAGIKMPVAKLIAFELNKQNNNGLQSESLADYSYSKSGDYPESLLKALKVYRKVKFL